MCLVGELKEQTGNTDSSILYCSECGGEYSANAADYFMFKPDHDLRCCECPLEHVTKQTVYTKVQP